MKLAVVTPIPTPYRDPFWNEVARRPDVELDVYYCAPVKADRPWQVAWEMNYEAIHLPVWNLARPFGDDASCYWNRGIVRALRRRGCDALILGGYNHITMLLAMAYAKAAGVPFYMMNEPFLNYPRKRWRKIVKRPLVKWVMRNATGLLPTGKLASEYLLHYGAREEQLVLIPNTPDVRMLDSEARRLRPERERLRREFEVADRATVLFVGRLIPKKGVDVLIRALERVVQRIDAQLIVLGSGPSQDEWERLASERGLGDCVQFRGFAAPSSLPQWHAVSDLFVLPSTETWSVAVLEALSSGLPVVISDKVGCHADVINDDRIGSVVPAGDVQGFAEAIRSKLEARPPADQVAEIWTPVRESVEYSVLAERLIETIRRSVSHRGRHY